MGGQIIDAFGTQAQQPRGERADKGDAAGWEDKPAKRRQKDVEARWTKKHGKSHGYKVNVDRRQARRYHVSDAGAQPSPRRYPGWGQHGFGCVGGQRLPRSEGEGVAEPDPSQGPPQQAAERAREARQQPVRRFGSASSMSSGPRNDMGGTLVRSVRCGRRRGSG